MINTKLYDSILIHKKSNKYIVANTYLHILDKNPEFLKKYNFSSQKKFWQSIYFFMFTILRLFQSINFKEYYYINKKNIKPDILFISHLTNIKQLKDDHDTYFGDLPNQLSHNDITSSICLINHIKANNWQYSNAWKANNIHRYVLNLSLSFLSEIKLYFLQRKSKKDLKYILDDLKVKKVHQKDILFNHLSPSTFNAHRIAQQIGDIISKTKANFLITTYEGHSWERLVYHYARKANPDITCFGYQHAAVFKNQYALKRPLDRTYNPDIILTCGSISQRILKKSKPLINTKIICIGSSKYLKPKKFKDKTACCLVIPQGSLKECICLFELSLAYANKNKRQKFIWRLHPLISFKKLKKISAIFKNLPNNIDLSERHLKEDIEKCDSVLYRGSTAVVSALNAGLKPIYYQKSIDELIIDPIYQKRNGKEIILNQRDLKLALNKKLDLKTKQSLKSYAQKFYTPFDTKILKKVLK